MLNLYQQYLTETLSPEGIVTDYQLKVPGPFNFAYDVIDRIAGAEPNRRAMFWINEAGDSKTFSFADFKAQSDRAAAYFLAIGIRKGDRVMLILKRHYEFWFAILGLHKIGAVAIPATNQLQVKDLIYRYEAAEIKCVVCTSDGEIADHVDTACQQSGRDVIRVITRSERVGWLSFDQGLQNAPPFVRPTGDDATQNEDLMLLYFTSGTTGMPKMVTHDFTYPIGHIPTAKYWHKVDPDGLHLTVADTGWAKSAWGKLYGQWLMEAGIYVYDYDRFVPQAMLWRLQEDKVTTFCAPPTLYRFLIKEDLASFDLKHLQHCTIAGEALNPEVYEQFKKATGLEIKEGYGQTEMTLAVVTNFWEKTKPGSMGKPSPVYNIVLLDDDDQEVGSGQSGEICIRIKPDTLPGMFRGYHRDSDLTNRVWYNGIYHTGDLAWQDEDGYLWFVGRADDIIKSSGYRIGPFEVESVLMEHQAVLECAITGAPDPDRGQVVKATVVLARGYVASDELRKELQEYVKTHTAPYKYPRVLEFVSELPKTISGKIRRVEIRQGKSTGPQAPETDD
ncbi:MAG: AMP-binding protein [Eubacteriales bacterium]|nr:AMP-binding protein [Eubacteriales bacterium]